MENGMQFILGNDGKFHEYDDTYDVVIHCESKEDQDKLYEFLNNSIPRREINEAKKEMFQYAMAFGKNAKRKDLESAVIKCIGILNKHIGKDD